MNRPWRKSLALTALALATAPALAASAIKVGLVTTLSGPNGAPGVEVRDGFNLAMKHLGGKLGGLPATTIIRDDQFSPDTGKQVTERLLRQDKVDFMTGIIYSNILLAVAPAVFEMPVPYISSNAGPSQLSGKDCSPWFASAAWQNDGYHEAAGKYATDRGFKSVFLIAPNYPAGRDALTGFKRFYKGKIADEVYPRLGQLDYAAELAQIRAARPDVVYNFMPGGMGINFIKQFVASGLSKDIQLLAPGFGADEDITRAVGEPMLGLFNSTHWALDMDNPQNRRFVADFETDYQRIPSVYAAQGYDSALMIDAIVRQVKGKVEDRDALKKAMRSVRFASLRGEFALAANGMPIQDYYLRVVGRDAKGRIANKMLGPIFTRHTDAYVAECPLK
jgi:branched-chain amino acid transport system substrate-binding protein